MERDPKPESEMAREFGRFSQHRLYTLCLGLHEQAWNGTLVIDNGFGEKRLFFRDGSICFAASSTIDDRMGEVLYRRGLITLEQWTDAAVHVSREQKFGQVLIGSGTFSLSNVCDALQLQVFEIVRSVFLVPYTFVQIVPDTYQGSTHVFFAQSMGTLLRECWLSGVQLQSFLRRLPESAELSITTSGETIRGTNFVRDILDLIRAHATVTDVVQASKLTAINTQQVIFDLVGQRLCSVVANTDLNIGAAAQDCKALLARYEETRLYIFSLFEQNSSTWPSSEFQRFASRLDMHRPATFLLDSEGRLSSESIERVSAEWLSDATIRPETQHRLRALTSFIVQAALDLLPTAGADEVRHLAYPKAQLQT